MSKTIEIRNETSAVMGGMDGLGGEREELKEEVTRPEIGE